MSRLTRWLGDRQRSRQLRPNNAPAASPDSADDIRWFHTIDLGDGNVTAGLKPLDQIDAEAEQVFRFGVQGKTVLDIGAWDGAFSFAAERRGAADVLAVDHFCWSGPGWGTKAGFEYAHARLGSAVRSLDIDIPDMSRKAIGGRFDVTLLLGVLYHVKDPVATLEQATKLTGEVLVIETVTAITDAPYPVARYFPAKDYDGDETNFWALCPICIEAILDDLGFRMDGIVRTPNSFEYQGTTRHIIHAVRNPNRPGKAEHKFGMLRSNRKASRRGQLLPPRDVVG